MIKDVAEDLKVTERTIDRPAAATTIPAFKARGSLRFSMVNIDAWIREHSASYRSDIARSGDLRKAALSANESRASVSIAIVDMRSA